MTRRQRRATLIGAGISILGFAVLLVLFAMRDSVVFFYTPAELASKPFLAGKRIRLGGLVAEGSLKRGSGTAVDFAVTDTSKTIRVSFQGALPDLFREGQGVVAEGKFDPSGRFQADTVLAKHDENYMPPQVAKALKERGVRKDLDKTKKDRAQK